MHHITWLGEQRGFHILERLMGEERPKEGLMVLAGGTYPRRLRRAPRMAVFEGGDSAAQLLVTGTGAVAVTVGMSGRDSVTFSSVDPDRCVLCVCREFPTLQGGVVSEQEIALRCATPGLPELLACAAALALGLDIAERDIV
ncbi:MAG TPA: hypothetical protein VN446_05040 [Candidatus Acidoferrum sp.]|nr:hypothetical protein [Candidatus Acidoferrum sp.]